MLNVKTITALGVASVVLLGSPKSSFAVTAAELAQKNNELLALDADLAVAKKKAELAPYLAPKPTMYGGRPSKQSPTFEVDNVEMNSTYGDVSNPVAEFSQNGNSFSRRRGDTIGSFVITQITSRQAVLSMQGTKDKEKIVKVIYLTPKAQPRTYGQIETTGNTIPMSAPLPIPSK